jgi:hypothetical protein
MVGEGLTGQMNWRSNEKLKAGSRAQQRTHSPDKNEPEMRGASPRGPARQPERLPSKATTFDRATRQQKFRRRADKPTMPS